MLHIQKKSPYIGRVIGRAARATLTPAILAALLAAAPPAQAQGGAEKPVQLGDTVITATRRESAAFESPAAVSVVTGQDIERKGVVRVLDALKDLPGVYVRDNGNVPSSFSGQVLIRGVAGYQRNAVLLNGMPINNGFSNGVNWSLVDPDSVARVEVVRGPFSSLYGGSAMGGVVNIITKSPIENSALLKGSYGSDPLSSGYAAISRRLSERVGLRAEFGSQSSDGFVEDLVSKSASVGEGTPVDGAVATRTSQGGEAYLLGTKGARKWWQNTAGLTLRLDAGERAFLDLSVRYHEHVSKSVDARTWLRDADGEPVWNGSLAVDDSQTVSLKPSDFVSGPNGEDILRYALSYETPLGLLGKARVEAYYSDNDYWYVTPTAGMATPDGGSGKRVDIPNTRGAVNAQLETPLGRHFLIAGVSFGDDRLHKRERSIADWRSRGSDAISDVSYRSDGESQTYAAYLQDELSVGRRLTLYLGLRYDEWSTTGIVAQLTEPVTASDYARRHKDSLSPKLSAVYKLTETTVLRASAGTAFRSPTLSDLYSTFTASNGSTTYASSDLSPETITAYEIGAESQMGGTPLSTTLFYNELEDMIASMSVPNPDNPSIDDRVRVNVGKARIQGFEIELRKPLSTMLTVFANYTYTDTEVRDNAADPASVGKHLTLIPKQTFNLGAKGEYGAGYGYLVGRYVGDVYSNSENLDTVNGVYGSYDPFFQADAKLGYGLGEHCTLGLSVFNLLDRDDYQSGLTAGRTYLAELALRF